MGNEKDRKTGLSVEALLAVFIALACILTVFAIANQRRFSRVEISDLPERVRFTVLCTMDANAGGTKSVAWAPDSQRIVTGEGDGLVVVWNARCGEKSLTLHGRPGYQIEHVCWSPDGKHIAAITGEDEFTVWDSGSGEVEWTVVDPEVYGLEGWSEDGKSVTTWNGEEYFSSWNIESKTMENRWFVSIGEQSSVPSPDGKLAAWQVGEDVWAIHTVSSEKFDTKELCGHSGFVRHVSWSPDSSRLAGATDEGIVVWNVETGQLEKEHKRAAGGFANVLWSPDGRHILAYTDDGSGVIFDAEQVDPVADISVDGRRWWSLPVAWSPDGSLLAAITQDQTVLIYGQITY